MTYAAPIQDIAFVLETIAEFGEIAKLPGYQEASPETVTAVLNEAARFASDVLAPLNQIGDRQGCRLENGVVRTPDGFRAAYQQFVDAGWNSTPFETEYGGQGLPWALATATQEMWNAANMSFGLCPLLTQGAVELLQSHGSAEQKSTYLPRLISGRWTGTMNMTEPQAGSDVGSIRTRAIKDEAHYRITGQKIFITFGEHDMAENIVHLVLARTPSGRAGVRGISLFIVPKHLPRPDGSLGSRNDVRCVSLEHKLGINGSPTAVLAFGEDGGAVGELVGEENRGIEYMFTMMSNARLSIGVQGLAIAERAYQQARDYARARLQGRAGDSPEPVPIVRHPDVRRMLMTMRAQIEAMRALIYFTASLIDRAKRCPDEGVRRQDQLLADYLIPVAKGWCTDIGCAVASTALQVHGGVGFVEQTGAAQHYRDARITPIYEGTNGIQAIDLVGRKLIKDGGGAARALMNEMAVAAADMNRIEDGELRQLAPRLLESIRALSSATEWLLETWPRNTRLALASASPYLTLVGLTVSGWLLAKTALAAHRRLESKSGDYPFMKAKIATVTFYEMNMLPMAAGIAATITSGASSVLALTDEQF
ncbi:MAG: acyl-CoA dehydrogenase [Dongiaceae bacterium]